MPFTCVLLPGRGVHESCLPGWEHLGFKYRYLQMTEDAKKKYFNFDGEPPESLHSKIPNDFEDEAFRGMEMLVPEAYLNEGKKKDQWASDCLRVVDEDTVFPVQSVLNIDDPHITRENKMEILLNLGRSMTSIDLEGAKDELVTQYVYSIFMRENKVSNFSPLEMVLRFKDAQLVRQSKKFVTEVSNWQEKISVLSKKLSAIDVTNDE